MQRHPPSLGLRSSASILRCRQWASWPGSRGRTLWCSWHTRANCPPGPHWQRERPASAACPACQQTSAHSLWKVPVKGKECVQAKVKKVYRQRYPPPPPHTHTHTLPTWESGKSGRKFAVVWCLHSPWNNTGWLGVKHQVTYLLTWYLPHQFCMLWSYYWSSDTPLLINDPWASTIAQQMEGDPLFTYLLLDSWVSEETFTLLSQNLNKHVAVIQKVGQCHSQQMEINCSHICH